MKKYIPFSVLALALILCMTTANAAVGDVVKVLGDADDPLPVPSAPNWCSIGVAFDGNSLYYDICDDSMIYEIDPLNASLRGTKNTSGLIGDSHPNAMAYDATRNGIWFGVQDCDQTGMPIYFWDFDDNSTTLMFHVPFTLINPATNTSFLGYCFTDGLAFNANGPGEADDEIWFSDDVDNDLGVFRPDGTFVTGYDATTIDPSLSTTSGVAIGGSNLYLANNGGGDVFRADVATFTLLDQFTSGDDRQEDMECDPYTFAPIEVMWVRTTTQGGFYPDVITAYEIEPETCGFGGEEPGLEVYVDIKPSSCPNPINPKGKGVIPVAILGTEDFDVTTIDPATVQLTLEDNGVSPLRWAYEDVGTPFEGELCDCHDLNGDGYLDLTLKFDKQEAIDILGLDDYMGETLPFTITGNLLEEFGSTAFEGQDCVWVLEK
ncbi:MAG: hypothetical protein JSW73_03725 [Candidatus Woesearchaeota archaeon]|nr:MAG: hypothetical protein JSW73_03725 [Candidatus Woesearchaeota archaeon]